MTTPTFKRHHPGSLLAFLLLTVISCTFAYAADPAPTLKIKSALYNKSKTELTVVINVQDAKGELTLFHSKGGVLGTKTVVSTDKEYTFPPIPLSDLGEVPCRVEARLGELLDSLPVEGASADCSKAPSCNILTPNSNEKISFYKKDATGEFVLDENGKIFNKTDFKAKVTLNDKTATPLTYEWDFAGGVMHHSYAKLLYPNKTAIKKDTITVNTKASFVRNNSRYRVRFAAMDKKGRRCEDSIYVDVGTPPTVPNDVAQTTMVEYSQSNAPKKGSALKKPAGEKVVLPYQDWTMQSATDARTVPDAYVVYGPQVNNINATVYEKDRLPVVVDSAQVELKYSAAASPADPVGPNSINSTSQNWPLGKKLMDVGTTIQKSDYFQTPGDKANSTSGNSYSFAGFLTPELASFVDEGYHSALLVPPVNPDHGLYMPGKNDPYVVNTPQPFSDYVTTDKLFAARMLPVTDIDDSGRVNPSPLFRIEANDIGNATPVAATDIVVSAARDLHCRECHAKDKIGAKTTTVRSNSVDFVDSNSDSLFDQEYAAIRNIAKLHDAGVPAEPVSAWIEESVNTPNSFSGGPKGCNNSTCHTSAIAKTPYQQALPASGSIGKPLSDDIHSYHGMLQYKGTDKTDVMRDTQGLPSRLDVDTNWNKGTGSIPRSLFPVKDAKGNVLPMEQNCLLCHSGKREQCYQDRMYTAGVTCYQCHGDMLAVGNSFEKFTAGADGNKYRQPWIDEPDCASCHTGNGNQVKMGNIPFFSAGVKKTAFDQKDRSATGYQPNRSDPNENRFAVPITTTNLGESEAQTPLFRAGKDNHGQVACAACHGAAHSIWPNRDPNANDNVTALQLQGHSGPIAECSVCHTAEAFAKFEDLDEGAKAANPKVGVLGGPHNMHPVNDTNWWKEADGDTVDSTPNQPKRNGVIKGGWHNDYAKLPDQVGKDQCAACHGDNHKGTRLSKTPVERVFVNEKGTTFSVKAGTAIGCNLCHSLEKSFKDSPTNKSPVINSIPVTKITIGSIYTYAVKAKDPNSDELTYQLARAPSGMSIDSIGVITFPKINIEALSSQLKNTSLPAVLFDYQVVVSDNKSAQAVQSVKVTANCKADLIWDVRSSTCVKITISSESPMAGIDVGQTYTYPVIAKQRSGEALSYSLIGQPTGMTIGAKTGVITWNNVPGGDVTFTVKASNKQGDSAQQQISLKV